jgi:hypothetical protein
VSLLIINSDMISYYVIGYEVLLPPVGSPAPPSPTPFLSSPIGPARTLSCPLFSHICHNFSACAVLP